MAIIQHRVERINSMFADLQFEPKRHIYTVDGYWLPSVTKLVESHAEKFNADKVVYKDRTLIELSAKKNNTTVDELRRSWKTISDEACDLGHRTHDFLERYNGLQTPRTPFEEAGVKFIRDMSPEYEIMFREIKMYSRKYWFAGMEDLILMHKETGKLVAADWKTNKDLFKNFKGQTLKPPFETLLDTPYNKYQLQLSYYQIMLEDIGEPIDERILVHLKPDGTYKPWRTFNLTEELRQTLKVAA